jgi:hypothetical protein
VNNTYAIVANRSHGLYVGVVVEATPQPDGTLHVKVRECRHVAHWRGRTGGITSLAAFGVCGPDADMSRIGAPAPGLSLLTGVVNVFPCSPEARATFEAAKQS